MNISYIDMCKLKKKNPKNEERNKREGLVVVVCVCVCGCSFGEPLRQQETFQNSLNIQTPAQKW